MKSLERCALIKKYLDVGAETVICTCDPDNPDAFACALHNYREAPAFDGTNSIAMQATLLLLTVWEARKHGERNNLRPDRLGYVEVARLAAGVFIQLLQVQEDRIGYRHKSPHP
jgi:hypothetical protein